MSAVLAMCEMVPGAPKVPRLFPADEVPAGICDVVADWPFSTARLSLKRLRAGVELALDDDRVAALLA